MLMRYDKLLYSINMIKKSLIKGILAIMSVFLLFSFVGITYASSTATAQTSANATATAKTPEQQQTDQLIERNETFSLLSKIGYFLLWPFVALAGLAMDNNLVYGSYLNLDAPLRKVRTIVRNMANIVLAFIFLWGILQYALSWERKMGKDF